MAQHDLAALKAAAIDGRGRNVLYRKSQLEKLQGALVKETVSIREGIVADTGSLPSEAKLEYSLALQVLRERYVELDSTKELELEYRIAKGVDAPDAREPYGIAIIHVSQQHTPFYSTIAPLCAAIAAGNCVILQLDNTTQRLPPILKRIIAGALDRDSFTTVATPVQDKDVLSMAVQLSQNNDQSVGGVTASTGINRIVSSPSLATVAVIDRSADLDLAAQALVRAAFSFGGRSPYSPDIVLVNEFTKRDLLTALVRATIAANDAIEDHGRLSNEKPTSRNGGGVDAALQQLRSSSAGNGLRVVTESACGAVVEIQERTQDLIARKVGGPLLVVHSVKSLDDAIDFLSRTDVPYLAAYHFGRPETGKYLAQFVPAHISFVNHIPFEILVGPAAPLGHPSTPAVRYPTQLFSRPSPAYITLNAQSEHVAKAFGSMASDTDRSVALQDIYRLAVEALPAEKRRKQMTASFSFFEHAFLIHFGLGILTTVSTVAGGVWWLKNRYR